MSTNAASVSSKPQRIFQLDGLRGLAIILVIFSHLRLSPLQDAAPETLKLLLMTLTVNGKIGVCILFMLSGYLMATLYPVINSKLEFWQKRYTRIFPAFITMCIAMSFIRFYWEKLPLVAIPAIVCITILATGLTWKFIQSHPQRQMIGKTLFYAFLGLQCLAAISYIFLLTQVPPAVFYQIWPGWIRQTIYFLGNATMTLPFGVYIPQLDGVYWSTIAEISYYLLYPILMIPIFHFLQSKRDPWLNYAAILLLVPFMYSLHLLAKSNLGLSILQIHLGIYFIIGATIGFSPRHLFITLTQNSFAKIPQFVLVVLCLAMALGLPITNYYLSLPQYMDNVFWLPFIAVVFFITLQSQNSWTNFLSHDLLRYLGKISFSLYVTHTIAIEMLVRDGEPVTKLQAIQTSLLSIGITLLLSIMLHHFLEQPYFSKISSTASRHRDRLLPFKTANIQPKLLAITAMLVLLVWTGYRVPVSMTAFVVNHQNIKDQVLLPITETPLSLRFNGAFPNLGMILFHIRTLSQSETKMLNLTPGHDDLGEVNVRITNAAGTELANNQYPINQIYDARFHPVGIPIDTTSAGQTYTTTFTLSQESRDQVAIINKGSSVRSAYFFNKKEVLTQPKLLFQILTNKLIQPFQEKEAQQAIMYFSPLLLLFFVSTVLPDKTFQK